MFHTFHSEYSLHHLMVLEGQYLQQGQDQGQTCHQDIKKQNCGGTFFSSCTTHSLKYCLLLHCTVTLTKIIPAVSHDYETLLFFINFALK